MKIAGQKNPGAWYRANKIIKNLDANDREDLGTFLLTNMLFLDQYFLDMQSLQSQAGVSNEMFPTTKEMLMDRWMADGIPLQVWMGKLTFTTYTKVGEGSEATYVPNYSSSATSLGNEIRGFFKRWTKANRQLRDVFNVGASTEGNPGGLPNATEE